MKDNKLIINFSELTAEKDENETATETLKYWFDLLVGVGFSEDNAIKIIGELIRVANQQ